MQNQKLLAVLSGSDLSKIAHKTPSAVRVMTALALRERFSKETDLNRTRYNLLNSGEKIVDDEYEQLWKDLENKGVGTIIRGRGGKPNRFRWNYNLKHVAAAALEGKNQETTKLPEHKRSPGRPPKEEKENNVAPETKKIIFPLRKNFEFKIELPMDITPEEIANITDVLKVIIK